MSSRESNPKMITKSFRLTSSEASRLEEKMRADDYTNLSRYIRSKVIGEKVTVRKPKELTTEEVRGILNSIRERIAGFGADYNRIAGELVSRMDSPGQKNMSQVNRLFAQMNRLAKEIRDSVNSLIDLFHRVEVKAYEGQSTIKTDKNMAQVITIVGNIVNDAEMKQGRDGSSQFIAFRVAVNESHGDDRKTTYYDVTYPSSGLVHFLKKGRSVCVVGNLSIWMSSSQDGKSYLNANISAKIIDLLGPKEN